MLESLANLSEVPVNARTPVISARLAGAVNFGSRMSSSSFHCRCPMLLHSFTEMVGSVKLRSAVPA